METKLEIRRQKIQTEIDRLKTQSERNKLGQFSTPIELANHILHHAIKLFPANRRVRFLDPAFGTGAFYSALLNTFPNNVIEKATGFEIDPLYGKPSLNLWSKSFLNLFLADFTKVDYPKTDKEKYNLIICNPPYVRHHHINGQKLFLKSEAEISAGIKLSGLAGLYCYFIALTHRWMQPGAIAGWLVPSEFMDVNYGVALKKYLLNEVTLLQIHRFDPNKVQFDDALVSSAVVWIQNTKPSDTHKVKFTFGDSMESPNQEKDISVQELDEEKKWTRFPSFSKRSILEQPRLKDFFNIKRGIATGNNNFFILSLDQIKEKNLPISQFRPILPSPRFLSEQEILADTEGNPLIEKKLFVLDSQLSLDQIKIRFPYLYEYLQIGLQNGVSSSYLCKHRKIWYSQERRSESMFYFTYIGRSDNKKKNTFRFILNHSKAIVSNSYLILYPKPELEKLIASNPTITNKLIRILNEINNHSMLSEGRVYGGGLHKMEPAELGNVPLLNIFSEIKTQ